MSAGDGTDEVVVIDGEILEAGGDDDDDDAAVEVAAAAAAATVVWLRRCDIRSSLDENRRPQKSAPLIQLQTNAPPMEDVDVVDDDDVKYVAAEDEAVTEVEGDGVAGGTVAEAEVVARAARADGECMPNMAAAGFPAAGG